MSTASSSTSASSTIAPGAQQLFAYTGEQVPNQVLIENLDTANGATFVLQAVNGRGFQWRLFGVLEPGQTASFLVEWPLEALVSNTSGEAQINVYGPGIFPMQNQPA